jgi:hypothetical protein
VRIPRLIIRRIIRRRRSGMNKMSNIFLWLLPTKKILASQGRMRMRNSI